VCAFAHVIAALSTEKENYAGSEIHSPFIEENEAI
jgi:hypothetical protein